ncbi:peptide chain release factor N(5)-glutamine methyltransferase [Candidatus Purcelliella pentastirinorum]|uniref:peptide chain release factor N(5)-glutamine methyltransferase n=1 Tax=Candidatus Purcelliella pentastirinorum TaxID=472834 RepID=A0AAX3NA39_9ENTR|nr:peptide chain release factor N(5)-glutamine methyltransferase [Candidatus Purcelliella pentastirinorum]WDI78396.1 peptide chain release factor N(5)-glutamine methyltransferase [Candidatus Purcelliella pentastirinorum]WDR80577.1 peptide chain release factor N(5)-glutamine methyltransferase [Candidatus Purcelliella pentastirinorum]
MKISSWLSSVIPLISYYNPKFYAEIFLIYVTGRSKKWLLLHDDYLLNSYQIKSLKKCIDRLCIGEPVCYIVKECEFWSLSLMLNNYVFIPRPETEILVEKLLNMLPINYNGKILELGTGSGAISLAIAKERPSSNIIAIDSSINSIRLAKYNSMLLKLNNISFFLSDWYFIFDSIKFEYIISNPPYLSINDIDCNNSLKFEPYNALFSKHDGIYDIEFIINNSSKYLYNNGWLLLEHGYNQKKIVQDIFYENNFINIFTFKDYHGHDRVTLGMKY